MHNHQNANNNRRRSNMRTAATLFLLAGLAIVEPMNAFVPSSSASTTSRLPLHAEFSDNGGGGGGLMLPPQLQEAMEKKNASRKKFGLDPLTVPQFMELQSQIADIEQEQAVKAAQLQQRQSLRTPTNKNVLGDFAKTILQKPLEDTCYSSFDCESPKVCCDLGFKKMCCSNGKLEVQHQYAYEPVPVDMRE